MIKRKIYLKKVYLKKKYIIFGILGIIVAYMLFFFIYVYIAKNRLTTVVGKSDFDISTVLDIPKDRITIESVTYNKKEFIEYDCIIDSIYSLLIVKVGKVKNTKILDSLCFEKQSFQERNSWFNYDITTPHPITYYISVHGAAWYNVCLIPFNEVNKISVFFEGELLNKEWLNSATLSYSLKTLRVLFSFNNMNKSDLIFVRTSSLVNIFLTIDKNNNLYIGCVSTNVGEAKTLKAIIEYATPPKPHQM